MRTEGVIVAASRMNIMFLLLLMVSFLIDLVNGDMDLALLPVFLIPFLIGLLVSAGFLAGVKKKYLVKKGSKYRFALGSFLYLVLIGSLPFLISGLEGLSGSLFESMAGFTTTGLSGLGPERIMEKGKGLLFFRCGIQWIGGLFFLTIAFMFLSDLSDVARRSADRKMFSRIGLVPSVMTILQSLMIIYGLFTVLSFVGYSISGMSYFDAACLSMSTVSTGGYGASGNLIDGGVGIYMLAVMIMILAGMGYYVHLSIFSARGRSKTLFDTENISYILVILTFPVVGALILLFDGYGFGESLWKGTFMVISSTTTTGMMTEGVGAWPDSMKILLIILMIMGGSSLSLASGLKIQRVFLLIKGFAGEVRRSSHPKAVITLRRGEGTYSEKALESANMAFFFFLGLLGLSIVLVLAFTGNMFDVISLCATAVSNCGIAFGTFSTPQGIASLNWFVKLLLVVVMFLGRFEVLVPLYVISLKSYSFRG